MPRTGRPKAELTVTQDEQVELERLTKRVRTNRDVAFRARIIMACSEEPSNSVVARRLRCTKQTVGKWRNRFIKHRLDGLYDEPRIDGPRKVIDEQVEEVIVKTLETKPEGHTHRAQDFVSFLRDLDAHVEPELEIHVVLDNLSTHKAPPVHRFMLGTPVPPALHATYASWLNLVERFFGLLTEQALKRGSFTSIPQLRAAILDYVESHNQRNKPFRWTKTADEILDKMRRFGPRTQQVYGG
jgi:transposase-like protein